MLQKMIASRLPCFCNHVSYIELAHYLVSEHL